MKSIFLFSFLLLMEVFAFAQDENEQPLMIGVRYSFDRSYRVLHIANDPGGGISGIKYFRDHIEIPRLSFTCGPEFSFSMAKHFRVETGILYSDKGYQTDWIPWFAGPVPTSVKFVYHFRYIDLPLRVTCILGKGNPRIVLGAGINTNIALRQKFETQEETAGGLVRMFEKKPNQNKFDVSPQAMAGIEYKILAHHRVRMQLGGTYSMVTMKDAFITENLWSMGVNVGYYYCL